MDLLSALKHFTGTDQYYRHWLGFVYTDGVRYLSEQAEAYWLLDAIGSYQPSLRGVDVQFWSLKVTDGRSAVLEMREDLDEPIKVYQKIEFTDFSLNQIELYFMNGVLLLPSEY